MASAKMIVFALWCLTLGLLFSALHLVKDSCFSIFHVMYSVFLYFLGIITILLGIVLSLKQNRNTNNINWYLPAVISLCLIPLFVLVKLYNNDILKGKPILLAINQNLHKETYLKLRLEKHNKFQFKNKPNQHDSFECNFTGEFKLIGDTLLMHYSSYELSYDTYFKKYLITKSYLLPISQGKVLDNPDRSLRIIENHMKMVE